MSLKIGGGGGRQILIFFKIINSIDHLFRMFPKVRSRYYHRKSKKNICLQFFKRGGGGGVTIIIYNLWGGALNVDQFLTYCSTPILKHFKLHRM